MRYFQAFILSVVIFAASRLVLYPRFGVLSWYVAVLLAIVASLTVLRRKHAPLQMASRPSRPEISPVPATTSDATSATRDTSDIDSKLLSDIHRKNQQTSLHIAAASNQLDVAQELLRRGVEVNAQNMWGATPLHLAVSNDNYEMVQSLLQGGANATMKNNKGETPLDLAKALGRSRLVPLLQSLAIQVAKDTGG